MTVELTESNSCQVGVSSMPRHLIWRHLDRPGLLGNTSRGWHASSTSNRANHQRRTAPCLHGANFA